MYPFCHTFDDKIYIIYNTTGEKEMKNNTLEITVDCKVYQVVQIIDKYDEESTAYICRKDDKYGVFNQHEEEMIIPFEYDNITYMYEGVYLLSKSGKMGLLHLEYCYDDARNCYYNNRIAIPCEYDYIKKLNSYGPAYILQKNTLDGISVQAYLPWVTRTTEEYTSCRYFEDDYLELIREDKRVLIDVTTGDVVSNDKACHTFAVYNTVDGAVIHELKEPDSNRILFIKNAFDDPGIPDQKYVIEFNGEFQVTYKGDSCCYPIAHQFKLVHTDGSTTILITEDLK